MTQINLSTRQKQIHMHNKQPCGYKGLKERWERDGLKKLRLADVNYYT